MLKKFIRDHKIHKSIASISFFDYLFLYKPIYILGPIAMVLVGMYLASFATAELALGVTDFNIQTSMFISGLSLIMSCIFIKNEILSFDDTTNRFCFIEKSIIGEKVDIHMASRIHDFSLAIGLLLILFSSWINLFIIAAIYFLWIYSIDNSADISKKISLFTGVSFLLILSGWFYSNGLFNIPMQLILFIILSLPYIFLFVATILLIDFPKERVSSILSLILIIAGFFIAYYNNDPLASTSLSVSLPFYIFLVLRRSERDLIRAIRYPMFLLIFFLFTIYPLSMIPVTIIYYFSKYYYWHRFDKHFPALAINDDYN